jgi:hypothetical protein
MSNRAKWAHWNKPKPKAGRNWGFGVSMVALGSLLAMIGVNGLANHVLWFPFFSSRFGRFVTIPTVSFFLVGGVFIAFGLVALFARRSRS